MPVEPLPCAGGGDGPPVEVTTCCAPAIASTAMCREDGTALLLVVRSGCADCGTDAPDPEVVGWIDTASGTFTAGPPPADAGPCAALDGCEEPTQPVAVAGLCLADGTPIAVAVVRDCAGAVTSEGWINLTTGAYSPGAPPAGTIACGDSRSIQVSGTFCDIDPGTGDVLGLVLIEYRYAADGSIEAVRLVDATTGDTYTPQGEVMTCPAGVEQPERDLIQLCDTDPDTGAVTAFVRDYARDENGAIVGHSNYDLDGAPYTPAGTVGVCHPPESEPCASTVEVLRLCDLNPDAEPDEDGRRCATPFLRHLVHDCTGALTELRDTGMDGTTPYTPVAVVDCGAGGVPAMVEVPWEVTGVEPDPEAEIEGRGWLYSLSPVDDPELVGIMRVTLTSTANTVCPGELPDVVVHNPTTYVYEPDAVLREHATYIRVDILDFDTFEPITGLTPPPDRLGGTAYWDGTTVRPTHNDDTGELYYDGPPEVWQFRIGNTGGGTSCSALSFAAISLRPEGCCSCGDGQGEEPCRNSTTVLLCDTPNGEAGAPVVTDAGPSSSSGTHLAWDEPATALWAGGQITIGPDTAGGTQLYRGVGATVQLDAPACPDTATVSVSVDLVNDGPTRTWGYSGLLRLVVDGQIIAQDPIPANVPVGWSGTVALSAPVPAAALADGTVHLDLFVETWQSGAGASYPKAFTASGFQLDITGDDSECAAQFLRTLTVDCDGQVVAVEDTTLDGQPYEPQGTVGDCSALNGGGSGEPCHACETVPLCDIGLPDDDQAPVAFLRTTCRDCQGHITSVTDATPSGEPYEPAGDITTCATSEPCRDSSTALLCDAAEQEPLTVFDPAAVPGSDGWQVVSYTTVTGLPPEGELPYDAPHPPGQFMGARSDLSAGPGPAWPGYDAAPHRWVIRKTFEAPEDGIATVHSIGFRADGGGRVRVNGQDAGMYGQWNQPATSGTAHIPVTAGPNTMEIEVRDGAGNNWVTGRLDIVMIRTVQFWRRTVVDCQSGETVSVVDTTLDGEPYEVTGEVGQCQPAAECCPAPPPELRVDVETVPLCLLADSGPPVPVLLERVYDDQSGELVEQRVTDPATGGTVDVPDGTALGPCPDCPAAFEAECVELVERSEGSYDNTSTIAGVPGQCGGVQGPNGSFGCQTTGGPYTITSWIVDGEEVIIEPRTFSGGPCGLGTPENPGMHLNWAQALTNLDPSGATWSAETAEGCAWHVHSTGGTGTVYGPMTITASITGVPDGTWIATPAQSCTATPYTRVLTQECDGTVSVSWMDQAGAPVEAPAGVLVPCGTGCGTAATGAAGGMPVLEACRCDDTTGDGVGDTSYVELLTVARDGTLSTLGTYTEELTGPYVPVAPVPCDGGAGGAAPATGARTRRTVVEPGGTWALPGDVMVQAVTMLALGGTATVTTVDGDSPLSDTESAGWSLVRGQDAGLAGPLSVAADTGQVAVSWTETATL